jgi:hypothetical protein
MEISSSLDTSQTTYGISQTQQDSERSQRLQTLATDLGVSTDDLETARSNGQSLSEFASSKGISQDTLLAAVKDSITKNAPANAPALSSDQLTAMATRIINHKPRSADGSEQGGDASDDGQSVQMPDSSLLALLGSSPTDGTSSSDTSLTQLVQQLVDAQGTTESGTSDGTPSSLQQLIEQLTQSSASSYGSDGSSPDMSGSIGLDATI